jgi:hypothetical protein
MPSLNFKAPFAPAVQSGKKTHTIRNPRKNPIKVGDRLYLYTGMRTKNCKKLGEAICTKLQRIRLSISNSGILEVLIDGQQLTDFGIKDLAIADGFQCVEDFQYFFFKKKLYPQRKNMDIIHWEIDPDICKSTDNQSGIDL